MDTLFLLFLVVVCCFLFVVCCLLLVACCLLFVVCCCCCCCCCCCGPQQSLQPGNTPTPADRQSSSDKTNQASLQVVPASFRWPKLEKEKMDRADETNKELAPKDKCPTQQPKGTRNTAKQAEAPACQPQPPKGR